MRDQNHLPSVTSLPVHQSCYLSLFLCLRKLSFLSLFKNLLASLAPWLEQVTGHIFGFWWEREHMIPHHLKTVVLLGSSEVPFASPSSEDTPLSWWGCTCDPTVFTQENIYLTVRITESQIDPGNWMVSQKQGKTEKSSSWIIRKVSRVLQIYLEL